MTRSFLALLHFDGGEFIGWQRQAVGRSVQGEVERVLEKLAGAPVPAFGAGRTDAGVHARGLGVSFVLGAKWRAPEVRRALNALLPPDCWVGAVHEMAAGFHARKSAESRRYRYVVGTDDAAFSPFRRRYEWALGRALDGPALIAAAAAIRGSHSFEAYSVRGQVKPHHQCTVTESAWSFDGMHSAEFSIEADRFLHHMVRMLVGTMVDIALGRRDPADMIRLLETADNQDTSPPAPPEGLYFVQARYPASAYLTPHQELHEALRDA